MLAGVRLKRKVSLRQQILLGSTRRNQKAVTGKCFLIQTKLIRVSFLCKRYWHFDLNHGNDQLK